MNWLVLEGSPSKYAVLGSLAAKIESLDIIDSNLVGVSLLADVVLG